MKVKFIEEPKLQFGTGSSLCPKFGIENYFPFDIDNVRPTRIKIGIIGKANSIPAFLDWLVSCKDFISAKETKGRKHPNLFPSFPGFNTKVAFKSELVYDETFIRSILNTRFEDLRTMSKTEQKEFICEIFYQEVKFLAQNKKPDIILCVFPEEDISIQNEFKDKEEDESTNELSTEIEKEEHLDDDYEYDLRRMLKARTMEHKIPIQIVRDRIVNSAKIQDKATVAWNLFTAIYYKAFGTPWGMIRNLNLSPSCYAGLSFYRSRDKKSIQTSIAQIFNEHGKGVILRGQEIQMKKDDRQPHLSEEQAYDIIVKSLEEYRISLGNIPSRFVLHKTSKFTEEEISGFNKALSENRISCADYVSIMQSNIRIYRDGNYPPRRGTLLTLTDNHHIFYTRGTVEYFNTYTGKYIPQPLDIRIFRCDTSDDLIMKEILALTKMNWNNTQFDRKYPITIESAKKVGDIMKYVPNGVNPEIRYSFYM